MNAIAVKVLEADGTVRRTLGYLSRDDALELAPPLDAEGGAALCNARLHRNDPSHVWSVTLEIDLDELGV
jgi:hypothetical protein